MGHGALRALALDLNLQLHGVPVTVTMPSEAPIETRGIWLMFDTSLVPGGLEGGRREPIRVLALKRDVVPTVPQRTLITAPEQEGQTAVTWRIDAVDRQYADHVRVTVVRAREYE